MDDYSALANRIAGSLADVRGCLILSRDGLILGSFPDDETAVKPAWVKFASLGEPERSFVEFGDQVWVYVRRPAYGAFAVADAGVRPGLVIDQLEQMLLSAEEARGRHDMLRVPETIGAPSGKPRTSLHPASERPAEPAQRPWARGDSGMLARSLRGEQASATPSGSAAEAVPPTGDDPERNGAPAGAADERAEAGGDGHEATEGEPSETADEGQAAGPEQEGSTNGSEPAAKPSIEIDADAVVDPVMLAKEFSGLLQVESGDDEGSP